MVVWVKTLHQDQGVERKEVGGREGPSRFFGFPLRRLRCDTGVEL